MATHYVALVRHVVDQDECEGHGLQAYSSKSDAAAAVADSFKLREQQEELLLDGTKLIIGRRNMLLRLAVVECRCQLFVGDTKGLDHCMLLTSGEEGEDEGEFDIFSPQEG